MSLTTAEERDLIAAAQHGDTAAYEALWAAYAGSRAKATNRFAGQGYDREEAEGEVTLAFAEALAAADENTDRLQGRFILALLKAGERLAATTYTVTIPARTADLARAADRGEARQSISEDVLGDALRGKGSVSLFDERGDADSEGAQLVDSLAVTRTGGAFTQSAPVDSGPSDAEQADVALAAMLARQRELARIKYGFDGEDWTTEEERSPRGLADYAVAERYTRRHLGDERAAAGELAVSRRVVQSEISDGLKRGRQAVEVFLGGAE